MRLMKAIIIAKEEKNRLSFAVLSTSINNHAMAFASFQLLTLETKTHFLAHAIA